MLLRYFYDEKLAHASYLVGCQAMGDALIVDPGRHVEQYLQVAEQNGMEIVGVAETHIHADYVSGARELAARTGATLYVSDEGPHDWKYLYLKSYSHKLLKDGDAWKIGNIEFKTLFTPGHTPEHISFMLTDTAVASEPMGVFTGDFVFVGDVGRPDLLEEAAGIANSKEPGARQLFHSLQKFKKLPDYLQIWPAHGAGSACGKSLGAVPSSTLGYEKMFNWAFDLEDEDAFVKAVLEGQPDPPKYFAVMKRVNKEGPEMLHGLPRVRKLSLGRFVKALEKRAWIVDARFQEEYAAGHAPGTLGIPLNNSFNTYAGWVLPYDEPIYLIIDDEHVEEAVTALIRVGLDHIDGYFTPEILQMWKTSQNKSLKKMRTISVEEALEAVTAGDVEIMDVRAPHEYEAGQLPNAVNVPLTNLLAESGGTRANGDLLVHCLTGERSFVASTLLMREGHDRTINLEGGYKAWTAAGLPINRDNNEIF